MCLVREFCAHATKCKPSQLLCLARTISDDENTDDTVFFRAFVFSNKIKKNHAIIHDARTRKLPGPLTIGPHL